ncbi:MAG TPA: CVNH domain-containing protein [Xanthobacteraceae bacterium]|nr:CVNH domain-containing protein [Xanthobacteraceae bacterium]
MANRYLFSACALAALVGTPAFADNSYQNTCSEIRFAYSGKNATLQAVCLKQDGTPNATSLVLQGISNQNGKLTQGSGPSTFQMSCGNIQIITDNGPNTTLSAVCRMTNGSFLATALPLNNIANNNGTLVQH